MIIKATGFLMSEKTRRKEVFGFKVPLGDWKGCSYTIKCQDVPSVCECVPPDSRFKLCLAPAFPHLVTCETSQ